MAGDGRTCGGVGWGVGWGVVGMDGLYRGVNFSLQGSVTDAVNRK